MKVMSSRTIGVHFADDTISQVDYKHADDMKDNLQGI
jgi:hypothetical protein